MKTRRVQHVRPGGFTLIELMVVVLIIGILATLISVGLAAALRTARQAAERHELNGLSMGASAFRDEFGFLPPLVNDGAPLSSDSEGPILENTPRAGVNSVALRDRRFMTWREANGAMRDGPDERYSKFSLPIYLMGALGERVDGVDGPGMREPRNDGLFAAGGREYEPFFEPRREASLVRGYASREEFAEHGEAFPTSVAALDNPSKAAFVDRNGRAYRYYRWEPSETGEVSGNVPPIALRNIPQILQDPRFWDDSDRFPGQGEDAVDIRGARYAIVGAGPSGLFGTEPVDLIRERLGLRAGLAEDEVRRRAWEDNIVEVGR